MIPLRQSQASQEVPLGPFVDAADGFTLEDALGPIAVGDIKLWKHGATSMVNASGTATFMVDGTYVVALDATDTNTLGPLVIVATPAGARPIRVECQVLPQVIFDSLLATAGLAVDVKAINGDSDSASKLGSFAITIGIGVVGAGPSSVSIPVAVDFSSPQDMFTNADQLRGKRINFTFNGTNSVGCKGMSGRIVANTAKAGSFPTTLSTLTIEPPLPVVPLAGDIFTISDGPEPSITAANHVRASVEAVQESTQAATAWRRMALSASYGTLAAGSTQTVLQISGAMTPPLSAADQVKGRVCLIVDESGSQAALKLQGGKINTSTTTSITLETPLTTPPAAGNVIIIL